MGLPATQYLVMTAMGVASYIVFSYDSYVVASYIVFSYGSYGVASYCTQYLVMTATGLPDIQYLFLVIIVCKFCQKQ